MVVKGKEEFVLFPHFRNRKANSGETSKEQFKGEEMANLGSRPICFVPYALLIVILLQVPRSVKCYTYKVGDLDSWGIPTAANPNVYSNWAKTHSFRVGDSLLFLYPPSQESVIQVNPKAYKSCNLKDPILYMNNGNSLFNITRPGEYYFTSGEAGHCQKGQKLHISLAGEGAIAYPPSYGPSASDTAAAGPSYPTVFGSIPTAPPSSSSSLLLPWASVFVASVIGFVIWAII